MAREVKHTFCRGMDDGGCGLRITTEDGRAVKIEGDADSPLSKGYICHRGKAYLELLYHPQRLTYPRIRIGERGSGHWQRISWDEALDFAIKKITETKEKHSAKSILLGCGTPKGLEVFFIHRLASLIGTPNVVTPASVCHMPRELGHSFTIGAPSYPDLDELPKSLILWGINILDNNVHGSGHRTWLRQVLKSGAKIIVVDPRKIDPAAKATHWARIRPGSDAALALALLKVTVEEELFDRDFVKQWTTGWEELGEYLKGLDLQHMAEVTWIEPHQIREIARTYATNKPGAIVMGNAVDHSPDSFQTSRVLAIIKAITGNVDVPGGEIMHAMPPIKRPAEFSLAAMRENQKEMLGAEYKIAQRNLFVPRHLVSKAILEGKPYPLKALLLFGTNPIITYADSSQVYQALNKVDFLMVSDFFMTPTAELADLVLPAATFLEYDEIGYYGSRYGMTVARPQIVAPIGECWPDIKVINELGKRLGFTKHFWTDVKESLDYIMEPSRLSFAQFKEKGILFSEKRYRRYEEKGFRTPSGKVELYSQQLKDMGYAPLPTFTKPATSPDYPLLLTCAKSPYFHHSGYRQIESLRKLHREPRVQVNPQTAKALGVKEGDWAYIETNKGQIRQRVKMNADLDPRVVFADYAWWFPERDGQSLHGWQESNLNMLTDSDSPTEPAVGSPGLRGIPCRLKKI
ncbi:molybdopterin-dependent oxidoreductase [Chloroflexota bacterium]